LQDLEQKHDAAVAECDAAVAHLAELNAKIGAAQAQIAKMLGS
jgi:flagellin-like hook-associated protein FlgL